VRVGLLIYGELTPRSGGYLYDLKLVEHLRTHGHTVEIISLPWRDYFSHLSDNISRPLFERLRRLDLDLLLQDELNHPSLFALNRRLRRHIGYPIVSIVHHLRSSEPRSRLLNWFYRVIETRYLNSVDAFIFNSHTTRGVVEPLLKRPRTQVVAHPAGDRLHPQISAAEIERRAQRPGALQLVFLGSITRRKAPDLIVEALSQLPLGEFELHLAGSPEVEPGYATRLQAAITRYELSAFVHLHGHLSDLELAEILRDSQVLVLPSGYEGYGIAYVEGMGFGLPAVGTLAGAAPEVITHGQDGYLIPPEDSSALATHLHTLNQDRGRLARMGLAARERFLAHPSWEESMSSARLFLEHLVFHPSPELAQGEKS
jgi:glycosyltransferase involved in cell wall biosynthesis